MNQNYNRRKLFDWLEQDLISGISEDYDDQSIEASGKNKNWYKLAAKWM